MDKLYRELAWALPKGLVKWCAIRVISLASVGEYSNIEMGELRCVDAISAWDNYMEQKPK